MMKYNINLYYIYKFIFSRQFRTLNLEKNRLARCERYKPGTSTLLKRPLAYVDANTCYYGYLDIFEKEPYRFKAAGENPYIIDCGANIGLSVLYFKMLYPGATLVAFEPDPFIYKVLKTNAENFALSNTTLYEAAVWAGNGHLDFQVEGGMSGRIPKVTDTTNLTKVTAMRLRDFLTRKIDFLKIDIEGAEYEVIKDCADRLHLVDHLFVEYHSHVSEKQNLDTILNILTNSGFRYYIREAFCVDRPFVNDNHMLGMDLQLNIYAKKS